MWRFKLFLFTLKKFRVYFLRLVHDEIAELLGISKRSVTHYISRALKSLRSDLKDYLPVMQILLQL